MALESKVDAFCILFCVFVCPVVFGMYVVYLFSFCASSVLFASLVVCDLFGLLLYLDVLRNVYVVYL